MTDSPETPVTKLEDLIPRQPVEKDVVFYSAGQGAVTTLVCGGLQLEDHTTNPLFSVLPLHPSQNMGDRADNPAKRRLSGSVRGSLSPMEAA